MDEITAQLSFGERTLWTGRPRQGLMLRATDALLIPFSLLWGGFALHWELSVVASGAPMFFRLWGIPFVLVGLHLLLGRFFIEAWQRARTRYAVTTDRVIIISGLLRRRVRSIELRTLGEVALTEGREGEGTICFGVSAAMGMFTGFSGWPGMEDQMPPRFDTIPSAASVFKLIDNARRVAA